MLPTPVDAFRARIRESRTCIRHAQPDVNFLAPFATSALFGPKVHFWPKKCSNMEKGTFSRRNATLGPESLFGPKGVNFHQESIGFISIRAMGTKKCILSSKVHFFAKSELWGQKCVLGAEMHFWAKKCTFGVRPRPEAISARGM